MDESMLTGEPAPVKKGIDDQVILVARPCLSKLHPGHVWKALQCTKGAMPPFRCWAGQRILAVVC